MKTPNYISAIIVLAMTTSITGCELSEEEKEKLNDAQIDLEQLSDQIIITYPANDTIITDSLVTVRADIPSTAEAQEVSLFVDGIEVAKDDDGAPWEISWPAYYTADGMKHTLLLKTITEGGNEVRNNQQYQVTVSMEANQALAFEGDIDGIQLKNSNALVVDYKAFPGANRYQLLYSHNEEVTEVVSDSTSVELSDLNVGEYVLRYRAIKEETGLTTLIGPWSEPAKFEILPTELPTIHQAKISNSESGYDIEVSWDTVKEDDSYTIFFADTSNVGNTLSYEVKGDSSLILSDISVGNYQFWLKRTNSYGHDSLLSEPKSINILPPSLPVIHPTKISKNKSGYDVEVSWEGLDEEDSYTVFFATPSNHDTPLTYEVTNTTSLILPNISAGQYDFWLKRTNAYGHDSLLSEIIRVSVGVFHKRYGGTGDDRAKHILATKSGQYLVLASTTSKGDSQGDDWIFMLDEQGEMLWEYTYNSTGSPKLSELQELSNGSIVGFGSSGTWPDKDGLLVLLNPDGTQKWEMEYNNANYDQLAIKGVTEQEEVIYILSEGSICTTEGNSTSCKAQAPIVESINLEDGAVIHSLQLPNLDEGKWDGVSSFSSTSSGDFLLSYSVERNDCVNFWNCPGAGITIVNTLGQIKSQWNSLDKANFLNGRYAAQSPLGGFVLSGQEVMGDGVPIAIFDSNGTYDGTYTFSGAYSNQKEYIAFNNSGQMFQLVEKSSTDWPILISIDTDGTSQERMILSDLKWDSASPAALDSAFDGGLVLLFTENQDGYNNPDVVIVKIAGLD